MQKEASILDSVKYGARYLKVMGKRRVGQAYAPIKAISPAAIGGGLVAGHVVGGYSGSAAAQANMYHLGYQDGIKKQAGIGSILNRVRAARGFATANGNTASGVLGAMKNSLAQTDIGKSAISNASKVAKSPLGNRVSQGVKSSMRWMTKNPGKSTAIGALAGGTVVSMNKSANLQKSLYRKAISNLQAAGKKNPLATKLVGGAGAFGVGLGVTHIADEHVDGALGQAAVYNFRRNNGLNQ